jgi:hypothetical protein
MSLKTDVAKQLLLPSHVLNLEGQFERIHVNTASPRVFFTRAQYQTLPFKKKL